jgi:hypothetical protein
MAVALLTCLSTVDVLFVEITESISTYREKHILNFTRLQFLYNDTNVVNSLDRAVRECELKPLAVVGTVWNDAVLQGKHKELNAMGAALMQDAMSDVRVMPIRRYRADGDALWAFCALPEGKTRLRPMSKVEDMVKAAFAARFKEVQNCELQRSKGVNSFIDDEYTYMYIIQICHQFNQHPHVQLC